MSITLGALLPVGSVIHSMLTEAQFQAQAGNGWVLADGRSATGTVYKTITGASVIPDMRGAFLRAKGSTYNPDGDLALGTYTADKTKLSDYFNGSGSLVAVRADPGGVVVGNETAPKSITVNVFMRIN